MDFQEYNTELQLLRSETKNTPLLINNIRICKVVIGSIEYSLRKKNIQ